FVRRDESRRPLTWMPVGAATECRPYNDLSLFSERYVGMNWKSFLGAICLLSFCFNLAMAQQRTGSLRGQVSDELGALVVGANVTLIAADGSQKTVVTNHEGTYNFNSVAPGPYTIRIVAPGFGVYEKSDLSIAAGPR